MKIKCFKRSLNITTRTGKVDTSALAEMGLPHKLELLMLINEGFKEIRNLTHTLMRLKKYIVMTGSLIHAFKASHGDYKDSLSIMETLMKTQR